MILYLSFCTEIPCTVSSYITLFQWYLIKNAKTYQYNATTDKMVVYRLAKELEFPVIIAGLSDNCLISCLSLTVFSLGIGLASMESSTLAEVSQTNPSLIFSLVPICK